MFGCFGACGEEASEEEGQLGAGQSEGCASAFFHDEGGLLEATSLAYHKQSFL